MMYFIYYINLYIFLKYVYLFIYNILQKLHVGWRAHTDFQQVCFVVLYFILYYIRFILKHTKKQQQQLWTHCCSTVRIMGIQCILYTVLSQLLHLYVQPIIQELHLLCIACNYILTCGYHPLLLPTYRMQSYKCICALSWATEITYDSSL